MIERFVHAWDKSRESAKEQLHRGHPEGYEDIVDIVMHAGYWTVAHQ